MASYRDIASTEVDANSPITATLMAALANNPLAIAEGAIGAPRVAFSTFSDANTSSDIEISGLTGYGGLMVFGLVATNATREISVAAKNSGGSYGSAKSLFLTAAGGGYAAFFFDSDFSAGTFKMNWMDFAVAGPSAVSDKTGTIPPLSSTASAIKFMTTGAGLSLFAIRHGGESAS